MKINSNLNSQILIIDDDVSVIASIELLLKQHGYQTISATCPQEALNKLAQASHPIHLILQDMNFSRSTSGAEGLDLLQAIKSQYPTIPTLLMTAWGSIELAVEGIKLGASDFLTKPWSNQQLLRTIETNLQLNQPANSQLCSRSDLNESNDFNNIIGEDPAMLDVLSTVARVAATDAPILILGESGTGKELIADAIHRNSARKDGALVKVNLGGMTTSLFESEMFGHVKGAFTDAKRDRQGRFELADEGTIFLDEIGDLDPASQVKLLRVLQDQTFQSVGSSQTKRSNFRVVSATNRSVDDMVAKGEFREDLLYRLNLITIELPPLRKRRGDIHLLVQAHLKRIESLYSISQVTIDEAAMNWLEQQPWPGNIRQLTQTVERAVLMANSNQLKVQNFAPLASTESAEDKLSELGINNMTLEEMEKLMILKALEAYQKNITKVADALGVSRAALYRRLEKYGIES